MTQEDQGFTVKDRRIFTEDGSTRPDEPKAPEEPKAAAQEQAPPKEKESQRFENLPPVDFSGLIISLSHAAMMHLGHIPDPATGQPHQELALARHTIDTIGMLKDKTKGNLTEDESRLIEGALTELRLAFVQAAKR